MYQRCVQIAAAAFTEKTFSRLTVGMYDAVLYVNKTNSDIIICTAFTGPTTKQKDVGQEHTIDKIQGEGGYGSDETQLGDC